VPRQGSEYVRDLALRAAAIGGRTLHAHDRLGLLTAHLTGIPAPTVYDSHEYWKGRDSSNPPSHWVRAIEPALAPRAAAVVTVSNGIARMLKADLRLSTTPLVLRNIPERPKDLAPTIRRARLRERLGLVADAPVAGFCGFITPRGRGIDVMINALDAAPSWHLVLIGPFRGMTPERLRKLCTESGVTDRIHFMNEVPQSELLSLLAEVDVGLCMTPNINSNYRHALPNKLFEYVMAGVGVIATDLPDIADFVSE
jgi:glycosyltransferase involved in cell wall biosynthesis